VKLNYKRTICVGFAFFLICAFWQAYDNTVPLILTNKFGMSQAWSGVIMALDNILALFLLPLFGAIMTALFARERTGKGDYVSASLYGTGNWVTSAINSGTQYFNPWPRSRFTQSPMGQAFETKDGKFVQIFVNEYERYFPVFCKAFNIEDMLDDERVNTRPALNVNGNCAIIVARCIEEAKKKTADEIMSVLQAGNVPCTVLRGIGDKYKEQEQLDQCLSNGYLGEGTYESGKHYYQPQIPIYMESVGVQNYFAQSKSIGADNDALFAEFSK
jgi:crotonobetainyl-CoA:carnitine CoA-transferase CaiB-like acyl-CoA transferase